ncbi:uncharacterized protein H6S33_008164 [Morchella sextelata]|uniref:uncharacterized protein n=1 Tax=Morchella sextelata TaxID=1174677 RepID=UPI001D03DD20|nr:uncharacterized protein H6S33_008164 [Morchella sextelata]KAH0603160.1 hypothetical protein H6S33_008164 [Morchella sextelata]
MSTARCSQCKHDKAIAEYDRNRREKTSGDETKTCFFASRANSRNIGAIPTQSCKTRNTFCLSLRISQFPFTMERIEYGLNDDPSSKIKPRFEICCKKGDVQLLPLQAPPPYLQYLLQSTDPVARRFRTSIREYNSALTFTSVKYTADQRAPAQSGGLQCFQIHGELYHMQGPLHPQQNASPSFAQLYFYDPEYAAGVRHEAHPNLDLTILQRLTIELHDVNPFIAIYKTARERLMDAERLQGPARILLSPQLQLIMESGADKRRHNLPTSNEIVVIIPDEYGQAGFRDIVLANRDMDGDESFNIINPNNAAYMPLHYVLLFPNGDTLTENCEQLLQAAWYMVPVANGCQMLHACQYRNQISEDAQNAFLKNINKRRYCKKMDILFTAAATMEELIQYLCEAPVEMKLFHLIIAGLYLTIHISPGDTKCISMLKFVGNELDEVKRYLQGRYIGPTEAVWRIFEFAMHEESPAVMHLAVHLPGEQAVYYGIDANREDILQRMESAKSTLMAFFQYNAENVDGHPYLYQEFPTHFTYNKPTRKWSRRKAGVSIGRMYHCNPMMGEKYYLRLLLTVVRGAKSFDDLRTVVGALQRTFKAACLALGLLEDDREWVQCFTEAVLFASGAALRTLFATALLFGDLTDPKALWAEFGNNICDDIPHTLQTNEALAAPADLQDPHLDYGLYLISQILADSNKTLADFDLPPYIHNWHRTAGNEMIAAELRYNQQTELELRNERIAKLNDEQLQCYNTIVRSVDNPATAQFFLQGPAGTGKTFLYNTICNHFRSEGKIVLCVASSGIAAQLLPGGRTSHSRFKIPIVINESSTCTISRNTSLAGLIQQASLIIWDEVPMQHKYCFEAVNRSLNDICGSGEDALFGNIPIVLGGDFAQILPIVRRGNRGATVAACLQRSFLWQRFQQLLLKTNMRVREGEANKEFANWLLQLSYNPQWNGRIRLPEFISICTTVEDLCEHVFPAEIVASAHTNYTAFKGRAILAMRNDLVAEFNDIVLNTLNGETKTYYSIDSADFNNSEEASNELPAEYLQNLNPAALPPSHLRLKIGAPVILLRNLYPKQGLCNGTRMTVIRMERRCIEVRILGGDNDGQVKIIPRIKLSTTEGELPFILTRKQFPVRLCFAMTVNKTQGQSLDIVGIDLRTSSFMHGQLYVALSRATDVNKLRILQTEERGRETENIVYPELLLRE